MDFFEKNWIQRTFYVTATIKIQIHICTVGKKKNVRLLKFFKETEITRNFHAITTQITDNIIVRLM